MSGSFLLTAVMTKPSMGLILQGMFIPSFKTEEILTIVGLLGTTVVPYNLFLHAALVAQSPNVPFREIRRDTLIAVGLGGLISLCIIIAAAALEGGVVHNALDLGKALEPLYGTAAPLLLQLGFLQLA